MSETVIRGDAKHRTTTCNFHIEEFEIPGLLLTNAPSRIDGEWIASSRSLSSGAHSRDHPLASAMRPDRGNCCVMSAKVSGTEGYAEEAEALFKRYESIPAADAHRAVLHLIPAMPVRVLDIGSGTGRDAAWFASRGHSVVAVEPTDAMRLPAMALHPSPRIDWLDDSLPDLAAAAGPRRDLRPRHAHRGLDASRRGAAPAGDAEPCRADAAGRDRHHEDPARAGAAGTANVRGQRRGDHRAGAETRACIRS